MLAYRRKFINFSFQQGCSWLYKISRPMKSWTKTIEGIGEVLFYRHHNAKRFILRIYPEEGIKVTLPESASRMAAEKFAIRHKKWVQERKSMIRQKPAYTPDTRLQTKAHALDVQPHTRSDMLVRVLEGRIMVRYPDIMNPKDEQVQDATRRGIELALRKEAHEYLIPRLKQLAAHYGISYGGVRIKRMKSRWGSCSAKNNINLNIYLMQLPNELIDYVLLHELAHIKEKNHQKGFWKLLNSMTDNRAKQLDRRLRGFNVQAP